jgi:hypothetical protein
MQRALLHAESRACAAAAATTASSSVTDANDASSSTDSSELASVAAGDNTAVTAAVSDDFPSIIEAAKSIVPDPATIWT